MNQHKVVFVRQKKGPAAFARSLEKKLNLLAEEGWSILGTSFREDGALIVAVRPEDLPILSEEVHVNLSAQSREVLEQLFRRLGPVQDGYPDAQVAEAVEVVSRKYPNPVLLAAQREIQAFMEAHRRESHKGVAEECGLDLVLGQLLRSLQKHLSQAIS